MPLLSSFIDTVRWLDMPCRDWPSPVPGAQPIMDIMRCPGSDES